jgi:hypothetical protein
MRAGVYGRAENLAIGPTVDALEYLQLRRVVDCLQGGEVRGYEGDAQRAATRGST